MAYKTANAISAHLGNAYRRLSPVFNQLGAVVDSPSGDGYVIRVSVGSLSVSFSVEALPLNNAAAHILARDKLATYQLLENAGVRVPRGVAFFAPQHRGYQARVDDELLISNFESALRNVFPACTEESLFIIKPSRQSHALGLHLCRGIQSTSAIASEALTYGHCGIAQEFIAGVEYRIVILDGEILVAYRKHNPVLVGDGKLTETQLIEQFNDRFKTSIGGAPVLNLHDLPPLQEGESWDPDRVPFKGEVIEIALETQNLSRGTWPEILGASQVPGDIVSVSLQATRLLGLRYSGVDIRLPHGETESVVIEVNGNPGFTFLELYAPKLVGSITETIARSIIEAMCAPESRESHARAGF